MTKDHTSTDAQTVPEARLRIASVMRGLLNNIDSGATKDHVLKIEQGDLERWFDELEAAMGLLFDAAPLAAQPPAAPVETDRLLQKAVIASGTVLYDLPAEPDFEIMKAGDDAYRACAGGAHYAGLDGMVCAYRAMAKVLADRACRSSADRESDIDRALGELLAKICSHEAVNEAMQTSWNDICTDTGCHPLDIEHGKGKHLTFSPSHWANQVAKRLFVRALKLRLEMPAQPQRAPEPGAIMAKFDEAIKAIKEK